MWQAFFIVEQLAVRNGTKGLFDMGGTVLANRDQSGSFAPAEPVEALTKYLDDHIDHVLAHYLPY